MNLWKKTLLATAVAAISTGAMAVDIETNSPATPQKFGAEALATGAAQNDGALHISQPVLTANAEYTVNDTITITATGAKFDPAGNYLLADTPAECVAAAATDCGFTAAAAGDKTVNNTLTWGLINQSETELTFRATAVTQATDSGAEGSGTYVTKKDSTKGNQFTLTEAGNNVTVTLSSIAAGAVVNLTAKALTNTGLELDNTAKDTFKFGEVISQYKLETSNPLEAIIDVSKERKDFTTTSDRAFAVTLTEEMPTQAAFGATKYDAVVDGNFTGFEGEANTGDISNATPTKLAISDDKVTATLADVAYAAGADTFTFTTAADDANKVVLSPADFSAKYTITNGAQSIDVSAGSVGTFRLNGASVDIPYVPYGSTVEQFVWVTNKGAQTGDITVTARRQDGTDIELGVLAVSEPGLIKLDALIKDALEAQGVTSERVKLNVTVNAPAADINVYAAYKAIGADDRLTLPVNVLGNN